jgi:hypothetical protein
MHELGKVHRRSLHNGIIFLVFFSMVVGSVCEAAKQLFLVRTTGDEAGTLLYGVVELYAAFQAKRRGICFTFFVHETRIWYRELRPSLLGLAVYTWIANAVSHRSMSDCFPGL